MDRRQFLSAVSILGSCRFVPAEKAFASQTADSNIHQAEAASSPDAERVLRVGIVAIGNSGIWILNRLYGKLPRLFRSVAVDTNPLLMHRVAADRRILLGNRSNNIDPATACVLAEATADEIASSIKGVDQLFILADMGGSMEAEVASVVARNAHRANIFTIGAVINPPGYPKTIGHQIAQDGGERLVQLGIPTTSLFERRYRSKSWGATSLPEQIQAAIAFERLYRSTVVSQEGGRQSLVSLDREGIQAVFSQMDGGRMVVGYGSANGPDSSQLSAYRAISHPLFDADRERSDIEVLVSIEAGPERLKLREVNRVLDVIRDACPYCIQIFGAFRNPLLNDDFRITVVAPEAPWKKT